MNLWSEKGGREVGREGGGRREEGGREGGTQLLTLACPCFPVLEVDISTILQGCSLIMTYPFLRRLEHWAG